MGQTGSVGHLTQFSGNLSSSNSVAGGTNNLPPLLFHPVHGENIRVSECGAVARRVESFCKGLTFSSRPVRIAEKVYVKIIGVSNNWSGVIRFGFTANDPSTLRNALPKYACPDMTNKPGCWAKALAERFAEVDSVLFYYVTQTGDVHFGINGEERGVFFTGVETRGPLWAVLDVYGNSTAVQLLDPRQQLNNSRRIQAPCSTSSGVSACQQGPSPSSSTSSSSSSSSSNIGMVDTVSDVDRIIPSIASLSLQQQQHLQVHLQQQQNLQRAAMAEGSSFSPASSAVTPTAASGDGVEQAPVHLSRFQTLGSHYSPLPFHRTRGRNVRLSNDRCVASRLDTEFSRGYVFTSRPIVLGEKIVIQVLATDSVYVGALAFGLTSCNPSQIPIGGADLPDDSDLLLDRPEYWVVSKDVAGSRPERGDEISVSVTQLGEVLISKNGSPPEVRMHVDHTLELWAFFDVYGTTQKIRIVGSFIEPQPPTTSSSPVPQMPASCSGVSSCVASSAISWPNSRPNDQQAPNLSRLRVCLPSSSDHPAPPPYHPAPSVVLTPVSASGTTSPSPAHPSHHANHHHSSSHHQHHSSTHQSSPASSASPTPSSGVLVVNLPPAQSNYLNQQQQSQSSQQSHGHGGGQLSHQGSQQQSGHHQNHRMPHMSSSSSLSVVAIPPSGSGTLLSTYSHTYIEPVSATTSYSTMESSAGRTGTMMSGAGGSGGAGSECSICYERPIDSVLYMCGHMCMCYECALQQWRGKGGGHCPLCRALIKDVIRTYKS